MAVAADCFENTDVIVCSRDTEKAEKQARESTEEMKSWVSCAGGHLADVCWLHAVASASSSSF